MSDKNKNRRNRLLDFFRYHRNELSGEERNSFERELQKDPFSEEAAEGLASIAPDEALKDITSLQKRLRARTSGRKRFIVYRIAASIAVLIAISALFIFVEKNKSEKQLADNSAPSKTLEIAISKPVTEPVIKDRAAERKAAGTQKKESKSVIQKLSGEKSKGPLPVEKLKEAAAVNAMSVKSTVSMHLAKGKILSSEDNMPVPGANVFIKGTKNGVMTDTGGNFSINMPDTTRKTLVANFIGMKSKEFEVKADSQVQVKLDPSVPALSEVVVVGYGKKERGADKEEAGSDHTPPGPAGGKLKFDNYIQKNLHRPDSVTSGQRVVVVVSFLVRKDGSLDSIRIVRSPGKPFSDEAIRVIKSGPSWNPAEDKGKPVEEEVRVRLVFR